MPDILRRESSCFWYYFSVQLEQIFWYWAWLYDGMSMDGAASFMLTGPAAKITNLGALKIVLGSKRFLLYLLFVMAFSFIMGMIINIIV